MMINDIIIEYLKSNRRLVIPEFGAFIVKESGEIIFSELLRNDDGILASLLASRGMNEMEVAVSIDRYIFEARHELESYGYCRLGALGTLRREGESLKLYQMKVVKETEAAAQAPQEIQQPAPIQPTPTPVQPTTPEATNQEVPSVKPAPKSRRQAKGVDTIIVLAIVILLGALVAIGYGYYVSNIATVDDDEAIEALRVTPNESIK